MHISKDSEKRPSDTGPTDELEPSFLPKHPKIFTEKFSPKRIHTQRGKFQKFHGKLQIETTTQNSKSQNLNTQQLSAIASANQDQQPKSTNRFHQTKAPNKQNPNKNLRQNQHSTHTQFTTVLTHTSSVSHTEGGEEKGRRKTEKKLPLQPTKPTSNGFHRASKLKKWKSSPYLGQNVRRNGKKKLELATAAALPPHFSDSRSTTTGTFLVSCRAGKVVAFGASERRTRTCKRLKMGGHGSLSSLSCCRFRKCLKSEGEYFGYVGIFQGLGLRYWASMLFERLLGQGCA